MHPDITTWYNNSRANGHTDRRPHYRLPTVWVSACLPACLCRLARLSTTIVCVHPMHLGSIQTHKRLLLRSFVIKSCQAMILACSLINSTLLVPRTSPRPVFSLRFIGYLDVYVYDHMHTLHQLSLYRIGNVPCLDLFYVRGDFFLVEFLIKSIRSVAIIVICANAF